MAGLVPGIHVLFPKSEQKQDVDARDKPGHDSENVRLLCLFADRPGDNSFGPYSHLPRAPTLPIALVLMTPASKSTFVLGHRHLLGIEGLSVADITGLLDLSEEYVELNRQ